MVLPSSPVAFEPTGLLLVSHLNLDNVREIVGVFQGEAASPPFPTVTRQAASAYMAVVKVQLDLPTPDHHTIRGHLQSAHGDPRTHHRPNCGGRR